MERKNIFKKLKNYIGQQITCTYYDNGETITEKITLFGINEYHSIKTIGVFKTHKFNRYINYISLSEYILSINDLEGNVLYENPYLVENKPSMKSLEEVIRYEKLTYGIDYISREEQNNISYLINRGYLATLPELREKWFQFVNTNYNHHGNKVILATISMLEKINNGMPIYDAEIKVYRNELNLDGTETSLVDEAIKIFTTRKQEYLAYYKEEVIKPNLSPRKRLLTKKILLENKKQLIEAMRHSTSIHSSKKLTP